MPLSDWSEKQFLALTAGIVGGVLVIMAGVLFYVYSSYSKLVEETEATNQEVQELEREARRLDSVKKRLAEASAGAVDLDIRVPPRRDVDEFLADMTKQAKNSRLQVKAIGEKTRMGAASKQPARQTFEPIEVKVECTGGYHDLGEFVNRVEERNERLVAVTGVSIKGNGDGLVPGRGELSIDLELTTYTYTAPPGRSGAAP